jgi:eukaryotic translation initiation factor 2C
VAASHDVNGVQYNMEWRLQPPRVEIIQDLEDIIHKQLLKFKDKTKTVPSKIFYFRDGVSESQFLQLLEFELVAIRRACLRLNIHYKPSVTFLVVQKRHHTRMFPKFNYDMDGKFANVPSGTIVDTQITHPTEVDFYLCSHSSIQVGYYSCYMLSYSFKVHLLIFFYYQIFIYQGHIQTNQISSYMG